MRGLGYRSIAKILGVGHMTVKRDLEAIREYNKQRANVEKEQVVGDGTGGGNGFGDADNSYPRSMAVFDSYLYVFNPATGASEQVAAFEDSSLEGLAFPPEAQQPAAVPALGSGSAMLLIVLLSLGALNLIRKP